MKRTDGSHDKFRKMKTGAGCERHNGAYGTDEVLRVWKERGILIEKTNEGWEVGASEDLALPGMSNCTRYSYGSADRDAQVVNGLERYR